MVYKLRIVSDEVDDFRRDILIDSEATFLDLKNIICELTGFNPGLMSSFFLCNDNWEKLKEITLEDMGVDMDKDIYLMEDTRLEDMIEDEGQKLLYTFDYLGDRSLYIQVKDVEPGKDQPVAECVLSRGEAPAQELPLEEIDQMTVSKTATSDIYDSDEDFYGSSDYDEDEIRDYDELGY